LEKFWKGSVDEWYLVNLGEETEKVKGIARSRLFGLI
jgi:hypothetical protein